MRNALYYPTIEFRDPDFVKRSLLVWDRVFRIVPSNYIPDDDQSIATAVAEKSVIDLRINDTEKLSAAEGFLDFYAVRRKATNRLTWPAGLDSETFVRINPEKIEARLLPLFEQLTRKLSKDGFMHVPPDLAGGYMFYLAKAIANERSLHLLTDSPDTWAVGSYFANDGNFDEQVYKENADAYLCNLAITDLLPDQLSHLAMDEILRFLEDHREEKAVFQQELELLRMEIARCDNEEHARYIINDFVGRFQRAKEDYRKVIGPFSKRELCSIVSVGVPAALGFLSFTGDPYGPLRISAGILFGAVSALAARSMIPIEEGVASYLVSVDKLSDTPSSHLHRVFEEFIND